MKNINIYKSWRDKLLLAVSKEICMPCAGERKEQYILNYDNPLNCGCNCVRVESILANVREINGEVEKNSHEKSEAVLRAIQ